MKQWFIILMMMVMVTVALHAAGIMVSIESNGVLRAEGMEPGKAYAVEWASQLDKGFTNNPAPFDGLVADSNGVGTVTLPMFFRVIGTQLFPDMVEIPSGINSGTDPDYGAYSLTNAVPFFMDSTEVTKAQWDMVYNWAVSRGYQFDRAGSGKVSNHPVQMVNWYDCVKWCNARSEREGLTPVYTVDGNVYRSGQRSPAQNTSVNGYRLPTSVEWEYAARGGLSGKRFPWGDTITHNQANYLSLSSYGYDTSSTRGHHPSYNDGEYPYTSPAGSFSSNGFGLYDMSGNILEWCWDEWSSYRDIRGGSWNSEASALRCGQGGWYGPTVAGKFYGFRTVRR